MLAFQVYLASDLANQYSFSEEEECQIRCCIDFHNLNKACRKMNFIFLTLPCWSMPLLVIKCFPLWTNLVTTIKSRCMLMTWRRQPSGLL